MAKKAKKTTTKTKKAAAPKAKAPGVIATIVATIGKAKGASTQELLETLVAAFPERDSEGMLKTIRIQANRHAKRKERNDDRGLVYYGSK